MNMKITQGYQNLVEQSATKKYQSAKNTSKVKESVTDTFESSSQKAELKTSYEKPKKLTEKQIEDIKQKQEESKINMLRQMAYGNIRNQSREASFGNNEELLTSIFGSVENALPELATTPEGAAEAIAPGGAYSVEAVSDRLMKMARALAGDDPKKIEQMEKAVKRGFEKAGLDIKTGKGLPSICYDTYKATMEKFESWKAEVKEGVQ